MSPEEFLSQFGIHDADQESFEAEEMSDEQVESECPFDSMSAGLMNLAFKSEESAGRILSGNARRLVSSMKRIRRAISHMKAPPIKVGELGGGTGLISLWLAHLYPAHSFHVFDYAHEPLIIGERWALRHRLKNVKFHHLSYADILTRGHPQMDFVFAEHAVVLNFPERSETEEDSEKMHAFFRNRVWELAGAIARLITGNGTGFIGSGVAAPWGLRFLCDAVRNHDLAIDWNRSSNTNGLEVVVRPGIKAIFAQCQDEALALLAGMGGSRKLKTYEVRPFEALFSDGWEILSAEIETLADGKVKLRMLHKGGYILKITRFESGNEMGHLFPAGRLLSEAKRSMRQRPGESVSKLQIDPTIEITLATR